MCLSCWGENEGIIDASWQSSQYCLPAQNRALCLTLALALACRPSHIHVGYGPRRMFLGMKSPVCVFPCVMDPELPSDAHHACPWPQCFLSRQRGGGLTPRELGAVLSSPELVLHVRSCPRPAGGISLGKTHAVC